MAVLTARVAAAAHVVFTAVVLAGCGATTATDSGAPTTTGSPAPASSAAEKAWHEVTTFVHHAGEDRRASPRFRLDGPARLRYTVTAQPANVDQLLRVADIMFIDERYDAESATVEEIIYIDTPGEGTKELGKRKGNYTIEVTAAGRDWKNTVITVVIEQEK
ncbi:hypothetical protein [Mycolicibacter senuensis]|uniref:hypothetical protein n=1 Tax=Mycolicibacter senuensis TaxID=386913 RepID=UPI001054F444|nr:hypothetical protein [Mycolicibacter senuensis]MDQ2627849.1 hypothetical protein [Actinomycetota bacterium]